VRFRPAGVLLLLLGLPGCANETATLPGSSPSVAPLTPVENGSAGGIVSAVGCPVDERRFCQEASALTNAITQMSADAVLTLSRPQRLECAELDPDVYTQCEGRDVLKGYGFGTPQGERFVISAQRYRDNLGFMVEAVDDEYSDDLGGPEPQILGVSACDTGEERSYHLVYTVGLADPDSTQPGARFVGTYEFTEQDRQWAITTAHFGWIADWELVYDEPLSEIGCGGIRGWGG
jgi:hypothetical protein